MINNRTLLFLIPALLLAAMPVKVTAQSFRPVAEVRTLARYQDELTQGKKGSVQVQRLLIGRISQEFRRALLKTWSVTSMQSMPNSRAISAPILVLVS